MVVLVARKTATNFLPILSTNAIHEHDFDIYFLFASRMSFSLAIVAGLRS
jgi:hypothetical protein